MLWLEQPNAFLKPATIAGILHHMVCKSLKLFFCLLGFGYMQAFGPMILCDSNRPSLMYSRVKALWRSRNLMPQSWSSFAADRSLGKVAVSTSTCPCGCCVMVVQTRPEPFIMPCWWHPPVIEFDFDDCLLTNYGLKWPNCVKPSFESM